MLSWSPNHIKAMGARCSTRLGLRQGREGLHELSDEVIERQPREGQRTLLFERTRLALQLGDLAALKRDLDRLARIDPDDSTVQAMSAVYWRHKGDVVRSRAILDRVLARDPNHAVALESRAALSLTRPRPISAPR